MSELIGDGPPTAKDNPYADWDVRAGMLQLLAAILRDNIDALDDPAGELHPYVVQGLSACLSELRGELTAYCTAQLAEAAA